MVHGAPYNLDAMPASVTLLLLQPGAPGWSTKGLLSSCHGNQDGLVGPALSPHGGTKPEQTSQAQAQPGKQGPALAVLAGPCQATHQHTRRGTDQ
jgi:hypothetical protein